MLGLFFCFFFFLFFFWYNLEVLREDGGRQEAAQVVRIALLLGEGEAFVVVRIAQQSVATVTFLFFFHRKITRQ